MRFTRKRKQGMRVPKDGSYYGSGGTIHQTTELDVEMHKGEVVAIWFRCATIPFHVVEVDASRAEVMTQATAQQEAGLIGVMFEAYD